MPSIENSPAPARADAGADSPAGFTDHLHAMFPTLISESEYPHFAREKASLLECIYRIRDEDAEGREQSRSDYAMGYTSFFSRTDLYNLPEFQPLATFIYGKAIKYAEFQKWDLQNFELQLSTLWINVNPTHAHHAEHVHPFSHISGVFYVSCVPGCGHIVFRDPRPGPDHGAGADH